MTTEKANDILTSIFYYLQNYLELRGKIKEDKKFNELVFINSDEDNG